MTLTDYDHEEYTICGIYESHESAVTEWYKLQEILIKRLQNWFGYDFDPLFPKEKLRYEQKLEELKSATPEQTNYKYATKIPLIEKRELRP